MNHKEKLEEIEKKWDGFISETDFQYLIDRVRVLTEALEGIAITTAKFDKELKHYDRAILISIIDQDMNIARKALADEGEE